MYLCMRSSELVLIGNEKFFKIYFYVRSSVLALLGDDIDLKINFLFLSSYSAQKKEFLFYYITLFIAEEEY